MDASTHLPAGTLVDGFRVKRCLAEGAMGEVYLAQDERLGRKVALKFIKASLLDEATSERFFSEARTTARFAHPHIVTVYAAGAFDGRPYLALEYLDGETLRERLDRTPLTIPEALRAGRAIAEALAEAHRHGVIHADLKPENVVVPSDGRPRVVDFGLARLTGAASVAASGTPAYMAPERWMGAAPTPAIDVWSFGVLLHELLEGERPLSDAELTQFVYAPGPVPLGKTAAHHRVGALLQRCLAVEPAARPPAEEVARQLSALLEEKAPSDETRSPFRGLEAFREADAADFSGREPDVAYAVEALRTQGALTVVGPSGIGKSSFVFAGVAPRLREGGKWTMAALRPGRRPLWSLAQALTTCRVTRQDSRSGGTLEATSPLLRDVESLTKALQAEPGGLPRALRDVAQATGGRVLLVVDQLEELFTLAAPERRAPFAQALGAAASADEPWRLVLSLRGDFLGEFAALPEGKAFLSSVLALGPLGRAALEEAVARPLQRVGFTCDDAALPARMASELDQQPAALPLLQFAAQALWDKRDGARRMVLRAEYEAMGGATGALAAQAERAVVDLAGEQRHLARALTLRLVNADGTRRPRTRLELLSGLADGAAALLDRLLERRLLVSGRPDEGGEPLVELAHESLVAAWPTLARWVAETSEERQLTADVEAAAALWEKRGRRDEETWTGDALADAQRRLTKWGVALPARSAAFLEAGARRDERSRRRRRVLLGAAVAGLSVLTLVAGGAALAFREKERQAVAQQEQIRLAAADMGRFELVLAPFDWDADAGVAVPVSAATLPALSFRIHEHSGDETEPGRVLDDAYVVRGERRVGEDGALHEVVELRSSGGWLELTGRGPDGQACGASWLRLTHLPGYEQRGVTQPVRLVVPTCQATAVDTVEIPAGPFQGEAEVVDLPAYRIDRHELTRELYDVYGSMAASTGELEVFPVEEFDRGRRLMPVYQVDQPTAARVCRFLGRRLQSWDEWAKAGRGGLWLDAARTVKNPDPERATPWGEERPELANLARTGVEPELLPVGSVATDVSVYLVADLIGNVGEWTRDRHATLYDVAGGNWSEVDVTASGYSSFRHRRSGSGFMRSTAIGVRCVSE